MNARIIVQARARAEILEAVVWYEKQVQGLGQPFLSELRRSISFLEENPQLVRLTRGKYREFLMDSFPFAIIYRMDTEHNAVVIVSVFHLKRNPEKKPR